MKLPGKTLVVCARGFDRAQLSKFEFESVQIIAPWSNAYHGTRVNNVVLAGFKSDLPDEVMHSVMACLDRSRSFQVVTTDGRYFGASGELG